MIRCMCCGKGLDASSSEKEMQWGWHKRCVKRFFGTDSLPVIELTDEALREIADRSVNKGLTVPGVQRKMSLHLSTEKEARLTIVDYPTGYILKPQTADYDSLPEYEHLAMQLAEIMRIQTVPHGLIYMNGNYAYVTRRVDRQISKQRFEMYAMEDFCQLSGRLTTDKYKGSYENCGKIIMKYSSFEGFDLSELFLRVVGSFIIGNSDMHLKNFSLIENEPASRIFRLSPAYDMLPVNIVMPADKEQMALTVNGKKRNIRKKDFLELAQKCRIDKRTAIKIIDRVVANEPTLLAACSNSFLSNDDKEKMKALISNRCEILR